MRSVVLAGILSLTAVSPSAAPQAETVELPAGFYTFTDLADRLSSPEMRLRAGKDVANRAAFISLHPHPKAQALTILEEALGLEVQLDTNGHSGTLVQNSRQRTKDRVWRGQIVERLKKDVVNLVQEATRVGRMSEDAIMQLDARVTQAEADFDKSLVGVPTLERRDRNELFQMTSTTRQTLKLSMEWDLMAATRPILIQALGNTGASALTSDSRLVLTPITEIGPAFMKAIGGYSNGLAWSHHEITHCLIGWDSNLYDGRLTLTPKVNLLGDRFVNLSNASEIGCSLPSGAEVSAGLDLVGCLYGSRSAVLNRDAHDWYLSLDQASKDFFASTDGSALQSRAFDPARPYLSQSLADWSKATNREVVVELSPTAEGGQPRKTFAAQYSAWRFRLVDSVLAPVDLMGFWHRAHPLPVNALVPSLSVAAVTEVFPQEKPLDAFYRATNPAPREWGELFYLAAPYYGLRPGEIDGGRESFMAWSDLRSLVAGQVAGADKGKLTVPLSRTSLRTRRDMAESFQRRLPTVADMLNPTFLDEMGKGNLEVEWKTGPDGKVVNLMLSPNMQTSSEGVMFSYCRSFLRFRFA